MCDPASQLSTAQGQGPSPPAPRPSPRAASGIQQAAGSIPKQQKIEGKKKRKKAPNSKTKHEYFMLG